MRPPLVMLHGWASSPAVWHSATAAMGDHPRIMPALPGHAGGAEGMAPRLAAWATAILAACPPRFDLCGWSLGGLLSIGIALLAPDRVRRIVLIGTSPCFSARPGWTAGLDGALVARFRADFATDPGRMLARFHALQTLGDGHRRAVAAELERSATAPHAAGGLAAGLQLLDDTDLRARLSALTHTVRVLHGADDALMPAATAVALSDALPQARLTLIGECGHAPHLSRPRDCAALIDGFLHEPDR